MGSFRTVFVRFRRFCALASPRLTQPFVPKHHCSQVVTTQLTDIPEAGDLRRTPDERCMKATPSAHIESCHRLASEADHAPRSKVASRCQSDPMNMHNHGSMVRD